MTGSAGSCETTPGLLDRHRLAVEDSADLFAAGMSSHASVNVMLGLEDAFDIEFPDQMLKASVFESVSGIESALGELLGQAVLEPADVLGAPHRTRPSFSPR